MTREYDAKTPGLLTWQVCLLAFAAGALALENGAPALCGLVMLCLLDVLLRSRAGWRALRRTALFALAFGLGLASAWRALPEPPRDTPRFVLEREKVLLRARVDEVASKPGQRLRIVLADAEALTAAGERARLPGRVSWSWDDAPSPPLPGERVEFRAVVKPVRGFLNEGGWDGEDWYRRQEIFWRTYARGGSAPAARDLQGDLPSGASAGASDEGEAADVGKGVRVAPPEPGLLRAALTGLWRAREGVRATILERTTPGQGQALLEALILGEQYRLSERTRDLVKRASLAHSLALSGQNVAYVVALAAALAWLAGLAWPGAYLRLPRPKLTVLLATPLAAGYCWLGLASPSLARATVMFFFCAALLLLGRGRVLLDGLFFALAALVLPNPLMVYDTGLQLSALAVAGVVLVYPIARRSLDELTDWLTDRLAAALGRLKSADSQAKRPAGRLENRSSASGPGRFARLTAGLAMAPLSLLAVSLCAQAGAGPLLWDSFGVLSPHLWLNVLWLPLQGFVATPLGLIGLILSLCGLDPAGAWLLERSAWVHQLMADGLDWLDRTIGLVDWAVLRPHWSATLGYYALLLGTVLAAGNNWFRKDKDDDSAPRRARVERGSMEGDSPRAADPSRRAGAACLVLGLALLLAPAWMRLAAGGREEVRLTLLDVGQGQAALIEAPGGVRALFDGGGTMGGGFDVGEAVVGPALTANRAPRLDWILLSHPDADHLRGLFWPLSRFAVARFGSNGEAPRSGGDLGSYRRSLAAWGGAPAILRERDVIDLGGGVALEVLHPPQGQQFGGKISTNEASVALRLTWRGRGLAVIPGDADKKALASLAASGRELDAEVYVLPHHGSRTGLSESFLERVGPRLALASCEYPNRWGMPHKEVARAVAARGCELLTTGERGMVRATWAAPAAPARVFTMRGASGRE